MEGKYKTTRGNKIIQSNECAEGTEQIKSHYITGFVGWSDHSFRLLRYGTTHIGHCSQMHWFNLDLVAD